MGDVDTKLAAWQPFLAGQLGAGATLLGLLFVGLSLNLARILADRLLPVLPPVRAEIALIVLVLQLVVGSIALVPDQPRAVMATEVLAVGGLAWLVTTAMNARLIRGASGPGARRLAWQNMVLLQLAVLPYFAGAGAGAPKSTAGGLEIARSFSTVNCGFSSCPKIIAVRFVGNERTMTLYSWTALM